MRLPDNVHTRWLSCGSDVFFPVPITVKLEWLARSGQDYKFPLNVQKLVPSPEDPTRGKLGHRALRCAQCAKRNLFPETPSPVFSVRGLEHRDLVHCVISAPDALQRTNGVHECRQNREAAVAPRKHVRKERELVCPSVYINALRYGHGCAKGSVIFSACVNWS